MLLKVVLAWILIPSSGLLNVHHAFVIECTQFIFLQLRWCCFGDNGCIQTACRGGIHPLGRNDPRDIEEDHQTGFRRALIAIFQITSSWLLLYSYVISLFCDFFISLCNIPVAVCNVFVMYLSVANAFHIPSPSFLPISQQRVVLLRIVHKVSFNISRRKSTFLTACKWAGLKCWWTSNFSWSEM